MQSIERRAFEIKLRSALKELQEAQVVECFHIPGVTLGYMVSGIKNILEEMSK